MNTREILDSLSDALLGDDRIFSAKEKELLSDLLRSTSLRAQGGRDSVSDAIAQSVGEMTAQRVYGVLGESIARRLPHYLELSRGQSASVLRSGSTCGPNPQPSPFPPGPNPPGPRLKTSSPGPRPSPFPPGPNPPGPHQPPPGVPSHENTVAVADIPEVLLAECAILEEFLAPAESSALLQFALDHEADFQTSEVVSPGATGGIVDHEYRRSRVLMDLGKHHEVIVNRIQSYWPRILTRLGHEPFVASQVEVQITASNDGDFFHWHSDNGHEINAPREITFVYFFHREPKAFTGGELRIYDSQREGGGYVPMKNYRTVMPQQNQLVLFLSSLTHEITPLECFSRAFVDSRFTVNGWLHN